MAYQPEANYEYLTVYPRRHTAGDKVCREKGKSPDRQLRSLIDSSVVNEVGRHRQPGGWLRSSHLLKKA